MTKVVDVHKFFSVISVYQLFIDEYKKMFFDVYIRKPCFFFFYFQLLMQKNQFLDHRSDCLLRC